MCAGLYASGVCALVVCYRLKSKLLTSLLTLSSKGGKFPDMSEPLRFFQTSFNHDQAKKAGVIVPSPGVDEAYDSAIEQITEMEHELEDYLKKQKKRLGSKVVASVNTVHSTYMRL